MMHHVQTMLLLIHSRCSLSGMFRCQKKSSFENVFQGQNWPSVVIAMTASDKWAKNRKRVLICKYWCGTSQCLLFE